MTDRPDRPRAALGRLLRESLHCPLCVPPLEALLGQAPARKALRIVAFRPRSIRLECRECGVRFSIDPENLADTLARREIPPAHLVEAQALEQAAGDPSQYLAIRERTRMVAERVTMAERNRVLGPHRQGLAATKPRKGQIRFPKRSAGKVSGPSGDDAG